MQPMQPFRCPHCGAPPPPGFTPSMDRQFGYTCPYCRQTSVHGQNPAPPPQAQVPAIIIVQGPGSDFDHDHHYHQAAVTNAVVRSSISWVVWLVIVLVVSLGGVGGAFMRCSSHSSMLSSLVWNGSEPLTCTGNDDISVSGVTATFTGGTAISATGNCHVKCTDCKITAPTAIEASGNAQVTIVNGSVRGTSLLADATGNARVTITGNVAVSGATQRSGNARVSAPAPTPDPAVPAAPTVAATAPPAASPVVAPKPTAKTPTPTKPKTK